MGEKKKKENGRKKITYEVEKITEEFLNRIPSKDTLYSLAAT